MLRKTTNLIGLTLVIGVVVTACIQGQPGQPKEDVDLSPSCGPERVDPFVGKHKDSLPAEITKGNTRVIAPNTAVTMDFAPSRLNIMVSEDGIVLSARCG